MLNLLNHFIADFHGIFVIWNSQFNECLSSRSDVEHLSSSYDSQLAPCAVEDTIYSS